MPNMQSDIIDRLAASIADDVCNTHEDEIESISSTFDKTLTSALSAFKSSTFDDDGFVKKMQDYDTGNNTDKESIKNVLNNVRSDYVNVETLNQSELLLRRDIYNVCTQMAEMHDVINVVRDSIIECNVSTGEVSRSIVFENHEDNEAYESQVNEIEKRHDLLMAIKNFIVPKTLMHGEMYVQRVPYAKLFAEIEAAREVKYNGSTENFNSTKTSTFRESIPNSVMGEFKEPISLMTESNLNALMESVSPISNVDSVNDFKVSNTDPSIDRNLKPDTLAKDNITSILENINVYNGSSVLLAEMGPDAAKELLLKEYKDSNSNNKGNKGNKYTHFSEASMSFNKASAGGGMFKNIDQDTIDYKSYSDIKGVYIKYLDGLRMIPIRIDRRIIGYYYVSTTMDLQTNSAQPNGMVDLSYQNYTRDRKMVDRLANIIIQSFDKKILDRNIKLKNEIVEIIMAHRFSEGRLSFIYIPESEVERFVINEDENGKGHSILEPTLFSARNYLMLNLYNILYTLNNNTTRIHYVKSSGLNKDYASQVQRTMRKFQSRRITIDDIYSYSGVLNKVGGMGEMVLPAGRNDYKALETDTIEAVNNPIDIEFLEQQRRQAISGTGVPNLLVINAIDEVDFAKTLEMANTRFLSTVSSYKIDFNRSLTKFYQHLLKWETDLDDDIIQSFRFQFNAIKQPELVITADMIQNFNSMVEMVDAIYYKKTELEDKDGNPTAKQMILRKELAKEYLPQLDFDKLDEIVKRVDLLSTDDQLQDKVNKASISEEDLTEVEES